jgi:hypothetical protein
MSTDLAQDFQLNSQDYAVLSPDSTAFAAYVQAAYSACKLQRCQMSLLCKQAFEQVANCTDLSVLVAVTLEELANCRPELSQELVKGLMSASSKVQTLKKLPELKASLSLGWKRINSRALSLLCSFQILDLSPEQ